MMNWWRSMASMPGWPAFRTPPLSKRALKNCRRWNRFANERLGKVSRHRRRGADRHGGDTLVRLREKLAGPAAGGHPLYAGKFQLLFPGRRVSGVEHRPDFHSLALQAMNVHSRFISCFNRAKS